MTTHRAVHLAAALLTIAAVGSTAPAVSQAADDPRATSSSLLGGSLLSPLTDSLQQLVDSDELTSTVADDLIVTLDGLLSSGAIDAGIVDQLTGVVDQASGDGTLPPGSLDGLLGGVDGLLGSGELDAGAVDQLLGTVTDLLGQDELGTGAVEQLLGTLTGVTGGDGDAVAPLLGAIDGLLAGGQLSPANLDALLATIDALVGTGTLTGLVDQLAGAAEGTITAVIGTDGGLLGILDPVTGIVYGTTGQAVGSVNPQTGLVTDLLGNTIGFILLPVSGVPAPPLGGAAAPQPARAPGIPETAFTNPALSLQLSGPRVQRVATIARRGLTLRARCTISCGVVAAVTVDRSTARRLGVGNQATVVGSAMSNGAGGMVVRVSSRVARKMARVLPTPRSRRAASARTKRAAAQVRSAGSASERRSARRRLSSARKAQRLQLRSVKLVVAAAGVDAAGRTSSVRRFRITVKR